MGSIGGGRSSLLAALGPLGCTLFGVLLGGCPDPSYARGTVNGIELERVEDSFFAFTGQPSEPRLQIVLTSFTSACATETARLRGYKQALETLQDDAAAEMGRSSALDAYQNTRLRLDRDLSSSDQSRSTLSFEDAAAGAPDPTEALEALETLETLEKREIGSGVALEVCHLSFSGTSCFVGMEGEVFLERSGSRFRGEGQVEMAELSDLSDPEGSVEFFFDVRECDEFAPALEEYEDELARVPAAYAP